MKNIRDLLARLGLLARLEAAIVEKLEEHDRRLYALEENHKLKAASITGLTKDLCNLRAEVRGKVRIDVDA